MAILLKGPAFHNINNILFFQEEASQQFVFEMLSFYNSSFYILFRKDDLSCPKLYEYTYCSVQNSLPHLSRLKFFHWFLIWISADCVMTMPFFVFLYSVSH